MMKKKSTVFLILCLTLTFLLTGCGNNDKEIIISNQNKTMIQELTAIRLSNLNYTTQQDKFAEYRTRIDYDLWQRKFDVTTTLTQIELAVAEQYSLVPKQNRITKIVEDVTETGYRYLVLAEMVAVPENASLSDTSVEQVIKITYWYDFDQDGVLINLHEKHRKGDVPQ